MTHDELLAKIDIWKFQTKGYDDTYEVHGILNALRAVVERKDRFVAPVEGSLEYEYGWLEGYNRAQADIKQAIKEQIK